MYQLFMQKRLLYSSDEGNIMIVVYVLELKNIQSYANACFYKRTVI